MVQALEAIMLVCFGFSWPMNLMKNIKAKTAKSMSLQFILLIITGYVAGITAKILNGQFNYVLVIYILNIVIVSGNVIVYFVNRRYDRLNEAGEEVETTKSSVKTSTTPRTANAV